MTTETENFPHQELGYPQKNSYRSRRQPQSRTSGIAKGFPRSELDNINAEEILQLTFIWSLAQLNLFEYEFINKFDGGEQRVKITVADGVKQESYIGYFYSAYTASALGGRNFSVSMPFVVDKSSQLVAPTVGAAFSDGFDNGFTI